MEKKESSKRNEHKQPSRQKIFGQTKLQITEEDGASSWLIGGIVEKGISDDSQVKLLPPSAPKPSVLPFPVARHRSHGPHWAPAGKKMRDNDENIEDDYGEDESLTDGNPIAAFAKPVKRKQKKDLEFSRWREMIQSETSSLSHKKEENRFLAETKKEKKRGDGEVTEFKYTHTEMDVEPQLNSDDSLSRSREAMTSGSGGTVLRSVDNMDVDSLDQLQSLENIKGSISNDFKGEPSFQSINGQIGVEQTPCRTIAKDMMEEVDSAITDMLETRAQKKSISAMLSSSRFNESGNQQGSMTVQSEIDIENRARLQRMSPDEIAEAQAELMEKMNPALLEVLKRRGEDKLKKQKSSSSSSSSDLAANGNQQDKNLLSDHAKVSTHVESDVSPMETKASTKDKSRRLDNNSVQKSGQATSSLWNAWSQRVEAIRHLRFSFDGTVIGNDAVQAPETGESSGHSGYSADNVAERDFLRTEGDPGAAGYTIKEALALSRSVIPGQRGLALHLLVSVLNKAIHNIRQNQVGFTMSDHNKTDRNIDWEAVWAFALGPEPELVLALRISLDDNHTSVVLACAKVMQCILSCDVNDNFFDMLEKTATFEKDVYTAPVFRSRPEVDGGFLHGGFWKYNAKPSNILLGSKGVEDEKAEDEHTIQDDIAVAGQDIAAGLIRMGILPRLCYLLETDPNTNMEECVLSILIAIARHSPTCADAIIKCQRLVETVVNRFTVVDVTKIHSAKIKSVTLLKVLAQSDKKNCMEFIRNEIFQNMMWHLYRPTLSVDHWIKSGKDYCKVASALMVEQLRFWKVCIQYGYCISYFTDFFPAMCLWLNPPTVQKLIENNVLNEYASISTEAFLVLEALARRLPRIYSQKNQSNEALDFAGNETESWSWSHVGPMVDLALKWIAVKNSPHMHQFLDWNKQNRSHCILPEFPASPLVWVTASVMLMLSSVLERVTPEDTNNLKGSIGAVPWLPEFVPKIGLEIIKNNFLRISGANGTECGADLAGRNSFVEDLCYLRHQSEYKTSLASVCCLHGLVRVVVFVDGLIRAAKTQANTPSSQQYNSSREGKILEDGILKWSLVELRSVLTSFMKLVASEWNYVQSIEKFGRGGPAPGVGLGWGASGGGFWSETVLLAQSDAGLVTHLLEIFQIVPAKDPSGTEEMTFAIERINSALGVCLTVGPRDRVIMEKALDILLQVPALKCLYVCVCRFIQSNERFKPLRWEYKEEDYLLFSKLLASHFRNRWLCVKRKKVKDVGPAKSKKGRGSLDTIPEDMDSSQDHGCTSLVVEWAHQSLPLPMHWFLSPISTTYESKQNNIQSSSTKPNLVQDSADFLEVAKGGLFFLLGIEAMSSFLPTDVQSPVQSVPLIWKLHSLSVILLAGMGVLEEEKSRDVYEVLQALYGKLLDESRFNKITELAIEKNENLPTEKKHCVESLRFQSDIHESYSTFIETLVEQFSAISYGDLNYGRQVAFYLHRRVETPVRLAAWNALSNNRVLELLPPLEKCLANAEGYLEPVEDDEGILEAYAKSWVSGALDRAATRGSVAFTLVLHHLSSFTFQYDISDKLVQRNKLVKSLLRDYSRKRQHEGLMLEFIRYTKASTTRNIERKEGSTLQRSEIERRLQILTEACDGNSTLLTEVEKLKSLI